MNEQEFHQHIILGLIQTTVNVTHLDLERRGLLNLGTTVDWTNLRTFNLSINTLFASRIGSNRERTALYNILVETRQRIHHIGTAVTQPNYLDSFESFLKEGITAYSRHIKNNHLTQGENPIIFNQHIEEQLHWGILENYGNVTQINTGLRRYIQYEQEVTGILNRFFRISGANPAFNNHSLQSTKQDCCWCLYNYRPRLALFPAVLREYLETLYHEVNQELQNQGIQVQLNLFRRRTEEYFQQQVAYLQVNLEHNSATQIKAIFKGYIVRRNQNQMDAQRLRQLLDTVLGQNGLDIQGLTAGVNNALTALQQNNAGQNRELSLVKLSDFSGKTDKDPHEWIDLFNQAAAANRWNGADRLIAIAMGYLKGAALDWAKAATEANVNNQIIRWDDNNNPQTSFVPRFIEKFAPRTKQNQWYQELMSIRQMSNETVDEYSLRFKRLLRKVNVNGLVPPALQVRMYLFGLLPVLTTLVSIDDPQDLETAIDRARTVETGYNYAPRTAEMNTTNKEVDELTKKLEQLTINYANLASVMAVQQAPQEYQSQKRDNRGDRRGGRTNDRRGKERTFRRDEPDDRTCYNCDRKGHIARNCRAPKRSSRKPHFKPTRDVHYADYSDTGYDEQDSEDEVEEFELYQFDSELYQTTRSGRQYSPKTVKWQKPKPIVDELEAKQQKEKKVFIQGPRKSKANPAPIESQKTLDVIEYLKSLPSGLTIGQAAHLIPQYRTSIRKATSRSYPKERESHLATGEKEIMTAAKINIRINGKAQIAVVDSGAATSIITTTLLKRHKIKINRPSKLMVVTASGERTKSVGIVDSLPITIGKLSLPTPLEVLESRDEVLILGNIWLKKAEAVMDWKQNTLTLRHQKHMVQVNVTFTKSSKIQTMENSESESDNETMAMHPAYYSDCESDETVEDSQSDNDWDYWNQHLNYNPWIDEDKDEFESESVDSSPAIFLAEKEKIIDQNAEWNLKKSLHVGPLDYEQQNAFQDLINKNTDIYATSQMDIGKTTLIKHKINTGNNTAIAKPAYKSNPVKRDFIEKEIKEMKKMEYNQLLQDIDGFV